MDLAGAAQAGNKKAVAIPAVEAVCAIFVGYDGREGGFHGGRAQDPAMKERLVPTEEVFGGGIK
jgi:hypothetical protein